MPPSVEPPSVPTQNAGTDLEDGEDASGVALTMPTVRPRRLGWAQLLRRVLYVDALTCPKCATSMTVIAFLMDPPVLRRLLEYLDLPSSPPLRAPARSPFDEAGLFADEAGGDTDDGWFDHESRDGNARAPP